MKDEPTKLVDQTGLICGLWSDVISRINNLYVPRL